MSAITPSTNVKLLKLPIELDNENQLTFASKTAQYNYFNSLSKLEVNDFTYQRKDGVIRFPGCIDDLVGYNYVMYQNTAFGNKWFYAYIDKMTFVNPEMTDIQIRTDPFQTWQFDITFLDSFVEREHVNDDTIGSHTIDEGLDTGEYEILDLRNSPIFESASPSTDWCYAFCVSEYPDSSVTSVVDEGNTIGGVFTSLHFIACTNAGAARNLITVYSESNDTKIDAIKNVYVVPRCCVNYNPQNAQTGDGHNPTVFSSTSVGQGVKVYPLYDSYTSDVYKIQQPQTLIGNYTPKNNKLYTYPYTYFYVSNKCGNDVVYRWEDFPSETIENYTAKTASYKKAMVPSTSLSAKLYFTNYKKHTETTDYGSRMYNYGVNYAKVPVCAWTSDYYTNWLTQNGVNTAIKIGGGVLGMGLGAGLIATGVGAGAGATIIAGASGVVNGATSIASSLESNRQAEITPNQSEGDINCGDVMYAYTRNSLSFYFMSIRKEYAQVIDKYFDMFGYKVNSVKHPNITGRRNWNYVKTIRGKIHGYIPKEDLNTISGMLDNGVTFWHSSSTFLDYSQANDIISANT